MAEPRESDGAAAEQAVGQRQGSAGPEGQGQPEGAGGHRQVAGQGNHPAGGGCVEAGQVDQPVEVGRVEQQQPGQQPRAQVTLAEDQDRQQGQVEQQDEEEPQAERLPGGAGFLAGAAAQGVGQGEEHAAEQQRGTHEAAEGAQQDGRLDLRHQHEDRQRRAAEADQGGQGEDQAVTEELAEQQLAAPQRVGQEQQQGAAFLLADDGVVGQQQGDQRHQEGGQAGQAGDRRRHRGEADLAGRGGAEPGDAHREQGEQQADRQQPAIAQAVGQFLAGDGPDYGHGVAPAGAGDMWWR